MTLNTCMDDLICLNFMLRMFGIEIDVKARILTSNTSFVRVLWKVLQSLTRLAIKRTILLLVIGSDGTLLWRYYVSNG